MNPFNRRAFIKAAIAAAPASAFLTLPNNAHAGRKASVVVVGGGFGGATAAKYLKKMDPALDVTLVERLKTYTSCPLSNEILTGHGKIEDLQTGYDGLAKRGVKVMFDDAIGIDAAAKTVKLNSGTTLKYDALVLSPGIDFNYGAVEGYSEQLANTSHPHAWKAGPQTLALKKQIEAIPDGGVFVLSVPPKPFRCPPGPYERASLVASYFKHHGKHKSKVLILDANDSFSKKGLFEQAWKMHYNGMIQWVPGAEGGKVTKMDAKTNTAFTDFGEYKADVLNIIPPHHAGAIAKNAGLANAQGWCEVDMLTMESAVQKDIWVIGDACIHGDLPVYDAPKSAHIANTQAKVAAGCHHRQAQRRARAGTLLRQHLLQHRCRRLGLLRGAHLPGRGRQAGVHQGSRRHQPGQHGRRGPAEAAAQAGVALRGGLVQEHHGRRLRLRRSRQ
jgi:sulfide dehydrogenase [flavocytochrome c] flavoprotein subunit